VAATEDDSDDKQHCPNTAATMDSNDNHNNDEETPESNTCDASSSSSSSNSSIRNSSSSVFAHVHQYYIHGNWIDVRSLVSTDEDVSLWNVVDPSTMEIITQISMLNNNTTSSSSIETTIHQIIQNARQAFDNQNDDPSNGWSSPSYRTKRQTLVERFLSLYEERQTEMAHLISMEMGAPIDLALDSHAPSGYFNTQMALEMHSQHFRYERTLPNIDHHHQEDADIGTTVLYEPIGVVLAITPWNWPIHQITLKVIPALLVGCTVILKPSEYAPLSAILFTELIHQAGFPPGVFQMIQGDRSMGELLLRTSSSSSSSRMDMISFTGSTSAGKSIVQNAANMASQTNTFPKVSLELGGKGANIIFADILTVDGGGTTTTTTTRPDEDVLYEMIQDAVWSAFTNSGQSCNAPTRLLVERSIYEMVLDMITTMIQEQQVQVDSAHKHGDHIGPVVNEKQYQSIQHYIQSGIDQGARLLVGGLGKAILPEQPTVDASGNYVRPTVFADCQPHMDIFQREIFGPVLCVTPFEDEDHAVKLANDTPYGLTHYVQSLDANRRRRLARALRSGMVELYGGEHDYGAPFGGIKASGNNAKEGGIFGLEEFCIIKSVSGYYNNDATTLNDDDVLSE
jgi:aldehyde dehydrogenase (NAD+)